MHYILNLQNARERPDIPMYILSAHYDNTPMQYTAILKGCKYGNFQMKNCDFFLIFAQNIDRGYTFVFNQYPISMF